jgi:hypothetical protein
MVGRRYYLFTAEDITEDDPSEEVSNVQIRQKNPPDVLNFREVRSTELSAVGNRYRLTARGYCQHF